jgi:uncharacterized protein YyaL (SSP411 family)
MTEPVDAFAEREGMSVEELDTILCRCRERLFEEREKRIHPLKDDKILSSWNGLMIAALAKAYQALGQSAYRDAAQRSADFLIETMKRPDGSLNRRFRQGETAIPGFLEDYAFVVWGLIELYESTFEVRYLNEALALNQTMIDLFHDPGEGGFLFSGKDNEQLIAQSKEIYDGATPSGNSVAVMNLLRLGRMTGNGELETIAEKAIARFSSQVESYPMGFTQFLMAVDFFIGPSQEIVIAGDPAEEKTREMIQAVHRAFLPNKALLFRGRAPEYEGLDDVAPFVKDMAARCDQPSTFWCEQFACKEPITSVEKLQETIASARK